MLDFDLDSEVDTVQLSDTSYSSSENDDVDLLEEWDQLLDYIMSHSSGS